MSQAEIQDFFASGPWAVVGASTDRDKYGNKVLRSYQQAGRAPLYAVNPNADEVEGQPAYPSLSALPEVPRAISVITPPAVSEAVIEEAARLGVRFVWLQPGAESSRAIELGEAAGLTLIHSGPCVLVVQGFRP